MKRDKENYILTQRTLSEKIIFAIVAVVLVIYSISMLFPLYWLVMSSLKETTEYVVDIMNLKPFALPDKPVFRNYIDVFESLHYGDSTYADMIFNSLWFIVLSVLPNLFATSLFGYVMAKYTFKGKELIFGLVIFTLTIPLVGTGGAYYVLIRQMQIYNTPFYPLVVNLYCFGSNFLYMYAVFKGISWSYAEAVFIDGGGHWTTYFKIMLPQALPVVMTLGITMAIAQWNDYMTVMLYLPDFPTVASGLHLASLTINRSGGATLYYTGLVVSIIPVLILFIVFADKLLTNLSIGGLKG